MDPRYTVGWLKAGLFSFVWEGQAAWPAGSIPPGAGRQRVRGGLAGRAGAGAGAVGSGAWGGRGRRVYGRRPRVSWRGALFVTSDKKCHFYH
jgi:hypothetical protein